MEFFLQVHVLDQMIIILDHDDVKWMRSYFQKIKHNQAQNRYQSFKKNNMFLHQAHLKVQ